MKTNIKNNKSCALAIILALTAFSGLAQADKSIDSIARGENGLPNLITFKESSTYKTSDYNRIFKEQLNLGENQAFAKLKAETDALGFTLEKFQLYHEGIKVEYATYSLHSKNGKLTAMSGEFYNIKKVNTAPKITPEAALKKATAHIGASKYLWEDPIEAAEIGYKKPKGELVLLPSMSGQGEKRSGDDIRLAYKFDIYAIDPVSRGDLYIDADTGEPLYYNATIKHLGKHSHGKKTKALFHNDKTETVKDGSSALIAANAATRYSGTQTIQTTQNGSSYILLDQLRAAKIQTYNMRKGTNYSSAINFTDANNSWTEYSNSNKDNGALDAHWGAEKTYDYFLAKHGRKSYNNANAKINSYVHYDNAYENAYWDGSRMTYGDGGSTFDILTSLDVCAHEIGHAVCETTANLAYQKESGAMNEGFSDIWGSCVEYFAAPSKATWRCGEDIDKRASKLGFRSLSNPKSLGQPDTYGGTYWKNVNCTPTDANDYCGVHTNSGVLNHWFYILSAGKSGTNDKGNSYNVTGITIDKAAKIAYRLESSYLSANSTYANARTFGIQAAADLYGAGSPEVIATTNAFYAVGIGAAYSGSTGSSVPTLITPAAGANVPAPVNLTWSTNVSGASCRIQVSKTNTGWTAANGFTTETAATSNVPVNYSTPGLVNYQWPNQYTAATNRPVAGNTYYWTVRSYSAATGTSSYSPVRSFRVTSAAALESADDARLAVYPNPSKGDITFNFASDSKNATVTLFDLSGNQFFEKNYALQKGNNTLKENIPGLKSGVYILVVDDGKTTMTQNIAIQD
ncbi:MAG TPA: M4 family metallopeptidase [Flavobacterium sp.]|nr:M4 family metallopeptidase [Flavobacterium sp.]